MVDTLITDSILQAGSISAESSLFSFSMTRDDFWGLVYISWNLAPSCSSSSSDFERIHEAGHRLFVLGPGGEKGDRGEKLGEYWGLILGWMTEVTAGKTSSSSNGLSCLTRTAYCCNDHSIRLLGPQILIEFYLARRLGRWGIPMVRTAISKISWTLMMRIGRPLTGVGWGDIKRGESLRCSPYGHPPVDHDDVPLRQLLIGSREAWCQNYNRVNTSLLEAIYILSLCGNRG